MKAMVLLISALFFVEKFSVGKHILVRIFTHRIVHAKTHEYFTIYTFAPQQGEAGCVEGSVDGGGGVS